MTSDRDLLQDLVDNYMTEKTKQNSINKISSTPIGKVIFTTYSSHSIIREIYEALLELNDVKFRIEDDGRTVNYIKIS